MVNAMIIEPKDNVIVAIEKIEAGDRVTYMLEGKEESLTARDDVCIYHKLARIDIPEGAPVVKYGEHIGIAGENIKAGNHVHTHNVKNNREKLED